MDAKIPTDAASVTGEEITTAKEAVRERPGSDRATMVVEGVFIFGFGYGTQMTDWIQNEVGRGVV